MFEIECMWCTLLKFEQSRETEFRLSVEFDTSNWINRKFAYSVI